MDEDSTTITTLLAEEIDKNVTSFGNYDEAKSRITINLENTSVIRKKNKLVKKIKEIFIEGEDEEEEEQGQAPLEITQVLGEDQGDDAKGAKGEEAKEVPKETKKKRKIKE